VRAPFDALAPDELADVAAQATIEFYPAGTVILSEDGGPVTVLRVIHSGAVDIVHGDRLLDLLGVGDTIGSAAMLSGLPPGIAARAAQDTLCYRIPDTVARPLLDRARRRELAVGRDGGGQPVGRLIRSATVTCKPSESTGTVAERMTIAGATAAIVELEDGALGIVTDRDLRGRVLARGRSGGTRIDAAMSTPVFTVAPDRLAGEVLYEMLERGIRHVPVISERGRLVGVLEDADLFAAQPRSWFAARRAIARARSINALAQESARLPALMLELRRSSVPALELPRVLSALADAITARALELTEPGDAVPATGVVWVAVGGQARRELTFTTARRGALISDVELPGPWRQALERALAACGCEGGVVSRDADGWWRAADGDELALSVLADRRVLWGTPSAPLPTADGPARARLLSALAAQAFFHSPPTGFDDEGVLRQDGKRTERLDIRLAAIAPITALGRWASAVAGGEETATPERLRVAAQAGVLSEEQAVSLTEAFELALELQIVHQLGQLAAGEEPDDLLDPASMSALTRHNLRGVFRAVSAVIRELRP